MPDNDLRNELSNFLTADILNDPNYPLNDDEPLLSSGLIDSFSLVDIALWVENHHGVRLDDSELTAEHFDTVDQLARLIEQRRS
jgi:acyl carrier protein